MDLATRQLQQQLSALGHCPDVIVFRERTGSTNDDAKLLAAQGVNCALVASRQQSQGRGQHQRTWLSPMGNLYLSLLLPCTKPLDGRLALEVGLNMINLPSLQHLALQLKWPNDLYSPLGKWGGILIEPINPNQLVIGVGVNLFTPTDANNELSATERQSITSLADLGYAQRDALALVAQLYHAILQAMQWFEHGSYRLAQRYNHHAAFLGQRVCFKHTEGMQESALEGMFQGINADGAAVIMVKNEQFAFYKGRLKAIPATATLLGQPPTEALRHHETLQMLSE